MQDVITIPKKEYLRLKRQAEIDTGFVKELLHSLAEIKTGRVRQVR